MTRFLLVFACFSLIAACKCKQDTPSSPAQPAVQLPNTPQTVAVKWQEFLENNQFDLVRTLSTPATQRWVNEIDSLMHDPEMTDAGLPKTVLQDLKCRFKNDSCAVCTYFTEEDGEKLFDSLLLFRVRGQWLVELPADEMGGDESETIPNESENQ